MKEREYIQQLLDRYMTAETTEAEERTLAEYFSSHDDIPKEWMAYQVMFCGARQEVGSAVKPTNTHRMLWWAGIAAAIAAMLLIFLRPPEPAEQSGTGIEGQRMKAQAEQVKQNVQKHMPADESMVAIQRPPIAMTQNDADEEVYDQSDLMTIDEMFGITEKKDPLDDYNRLYKKLKEECDRAFQEKEIAVADNKTDEDSVFDN